MKGLKYCLLAMVGVCVIGLSGCEAKSDDTKTDKNDTITIAANQTKKPSPKPTIPFHKRALELVQNAKVEGYQGITFKQLLDKWTNVCNSVEWESQPYEIPKERKADGAVVVAWCEVKDIDSVKNTLNGYYNKGLKDFSYNEATNNIVKFVKEHEGKAEERAIINQIPGGENLLDKLTKEQETAIMKYVTEKYYIPFSQAIKESNKIYITFPFAIMGEENMMGSTNLLFDSYLLKETFAWLFIEADRESGYYGILKKNSIDIDLRLGFEINGKKYFSEIISDYNGNFTDLTILESMYFNKKSITDIINKYYLREYAEIKLFGSIPKSLMPTIAQREAMYKDIAEYIAKVYSEN